MAQRNYFSMSVEDYLIEIHRREEGQWTINSFEAGNVVILESLGVQFPIEDAYEGTSLVYEP